MIAFAEHEAYTGPSAPSYPVRQWMKNESGFTGDVALAAKKIYEFTTLAEPPLRWQIGKDAVKGVQKQLEGMLRESKKFESWSENLKLSKL
jgi:hypothetical protein